MRILIIIPTLRSGGAEKVVASLSRAFISKGHNVMVVTFSKGRVDYPVDQIRELAVEAHPSFIMKIINVIRRTAKLKKVKREFSPDISLSFLFGSNLTNLFSRIKGDVVVCSVRSSAERDVRFLTRLINRFVYMFSDFIVVVSDGIRLELIKQYGTHINKIEIIYNFVDFHKNTVPKIKKTTSIDLITVGRLEEVKGHWHLFHAVNQLKTIYPMIKLKILGEGNLFSLLNHEIKELGLVDNVVLLGFQKDTRRYLNAADIFCFSSRNEGMPNALLEAMSHGLPIISTDIPHGPKVILNPPGIDLYENDEIMVDEKYGLLVDYGNNPKSNHIGYRDDFIVNQFVDKIQLLIENKELYNHYSRQSVRRVLDFSEDKIVDQWIGLFERLTNE